MPVPTAMQSEGSLIAHAEPSLGSRPASFEDDNATSFGSDHAVSSNPPVQTATRCKDIDCMRLLASAVGFFADAHDIFSIDACKGMLYVTCFEKISDAALTMVTTSTIAGSVIGQLAFGFLGDYFGRRVMFVTTAILCIVGNIASALVGFGYTERALAFPIIYQLSVVRFFLGIGIGGEYPLAATVASESNDGDEEVNEPATGCLYFLKQQPNKVAAIFAFQGLGMIFSPVLIMILIPAGWSLETIWRFVLGIGAVPSFLAFGYRWTMQESASFRRTKRELSLAGDEVDGDKLLDYKTVQTFATDATGTGEGCSPLATDASRTVGFKKGVTIIHDGPSRMRTGVMRMDTTQFEKPRSHLRTHLRASWVAIKKFRWTLVGTMFTWSLMNVTFYGQGTFKAEVVSQIFQLHKFRMLSAVDYDGGEIRREIIFQDSPLQRQRDFLRSQLFPLSDENRADVYSLEDGVMIPILNGTSWTYPDHRSDGEDFSTPTTSQSHSPRRSLQADDKETRNRNRVFQEAVMGSAVAAIACPGYVLATLFVHRIGLRRLTLWGFIATSGTFLILGVYSFFDLGIRGIDLTLFGMTFLFTNCGPNTTTYILGAILYPHLVRATCHGLSAACGKVGAVIGTVMFKPVLKAWGMGVLQLICSGVAAAGAFVTYFFIPRDDQAVKALAAHNTEFKRKATRRLETLRTMGANHTSVSFESEEGSDEVEMKAGPIRKDSSKR